LPLMGPLRKSMLRLLAEMRDDSGTSEQLKAQNDAESRP